MKKEIDYIGIIILSSLFILLSYAGFLSWKSIDWDILDRLEKAPLIIPNPIPTSVSTPSATPSTKK